MAREMFYTSYQCVSLLFWLRLTVANPIIDANLIKNYMTREAFSQLQQYEEGRIISTNLSDVTFFLFTPENGPDLGDKFQFNIDIEPVEMIRQGFRKRRDTKVIIHGWGMNGSEYTQRFAEAYFNSSNPKYNVIGIEYTKLATLNYYQAAKNAVLVGQYAGEHLGVNILMDGLGQKTSQIHAIGHSLGSHCAGHFGKTVRDMGDAGSIARISALDPAKPYYDMADEENMLDINDAELVDVIHTNSGDMVDGCLSFFRPLGHSDFYPNGGIHQPGCTSMCKPPLGCGNGNIIDLIKGGCSHARSNEYYLESITKPTEAFISKSCESFDEYINDTCTKRDPEANMGEGFTLSPEARSIIDCNVADDLKYYLKTNIRSPFSQS